MNRPLNNNLDALGRIVVLAPVVVSGFAPRITYEREAFQ